MKILNIKKQRNEIVVKYVVNYLKAIVKKKTVKEKENS